MFYSQLDADSLYYYVELRNTSQQKKVTATQCYNVMYEY